MAIVESIGSFLSTEIKSATKPVEDRIAQIGERVKSGEEGTAIGEALRESAISKEEERNELNSVKSSFSGLMADLAATSSSIEGDIAGKTTGVKELWGKINTLKKVCDFNDFKKIVDGGKLLLKNKKGDGRFDKEEFSNIYGTCPVCGKKLEKPTRDGFCSKKCALKQNAENLLGGIAEAKASAENITGNLGAIVDMSNTLIGGIDDVTSELASISDRGLDPRYEVYFKVALTSLKIYLKRNINELLIMKNHLLMHEIEKSMQRINASAIADKANSVVSRIETAAQAAKKIMDQANDIYSKAYDLVVNTLVPFKIAPESMNFNFTIRSMAYYPGKFVVKLDNNNANDSVCNVVMEDKLIGMVEGMFPHLTEDDMVLSPEKFNIRKITSEYNMRAIQKISAALTMLLKTGSEPLPKYDDLKLTNVWWMIFLLSSWGPQGKKHYAIPFFP